jgi:flagellar biosynthesis/type III secretory pathway protein FliH
MGDRTIISFDYAIKHILRDELKMTKKERKTYERFVGDQTDADTMMETAVMKGIVKGREEGIEIGREEGIEIGREEGIEIGREEGIEIGREEGEKEAARKIAVAMKNTGYSVEDTVNLTGLTAEEIRAL